MRKLIRFRLFALSTVVLVLVTASGCEEDLTINSRPPKAPGAKVIHVATGGAGLGTAENPLGSIQAALDSAMVDGEIGTVLIAAGDYDEHLEIRTPVVIRGGLDPQAAWESDSGATTVVRGDRVLGNGIGVLVEADGRVELRDLSIAAPDAGALGAGSYGVVCRNSSDVHLVRCRVRARDGQRGANGTEGGRGANGDSGGTPEPGMLYAAGGYGADANREEPERGYCADGSQTGGRDGNEGGDGSDGISGEGAAAELRWTTDGAALWLVAVPGSPGGAGVAGCGGGGGRAGYRLYPNGIEAIPGGGGGGGGQGGNGGMGGQGGGCSVGLLVYNSTLTVSELVVVTGRGGDGGKGGEGGDGGQGGTGGEGMRYSVLVRSRDGGDGGRGGRGGRGGGGAGGWSVGVVLSPGSVLHGEPEAVTLGERGKGGDPEGADGQTLVSHEAGE